MKKLKTVIYFTTFSILASPLVATVVQLLKSDPGVGGG
ncbi:putative membrane protein [Bacillus pseudomycoides]|nr:putative membrane protein [Bacillus pseudomycoides]